MPRIETEITEITTGLGALGHDLLAALADPPPQFVNVPPAIWENLRKAYDQGNHRDLFTTAWLNGRAFLLAADGLRGRIPIRIEWKGPDKQVEQDPIPADLRIDNVFLVSIKTRSAVLWNRSPAQVFLRHAQPGHWYVETAPDEYQALYDAARSLGEFPELPHNVVHLTRPQGAHLAARFPSRQWPEQLAVPYREMAQQCAIRSAQLWNGSISSRLQRERVAWWLLRLAPAPYYLLGDSVAAPLRIRVDTPWDWRQRWEFLDLDISAALDAGQPQVNWTLHARDRTDGDTRETSGYVEIRWSHGRFSGAPEAKVQLRTRHEDVPGYTPLT
jgi:hypothetical protein